MHCKVLSSELDCRSFRHGGPDAEFRRAFAHARTRAVAAALHPQHDGRRHALYRGARRRNRGDRSDRARCGGAGPNAIHAGSDAAACGSARRSWPAASVSLALIVKSRRAGVDLARGSARKFVLALMPSAICAAAVSLALAVQGQTTLIPAVWLTGYGSAVIAAGTHSVSTVPMMGAAFVVAGLAALFVAAAVPERTARARVRRNSHRLRHAHRASSWRVDRESGRPPARSAARGATPGRRNRSSKSVIGHLRDEGGAEVFRLVNERVRLGILSALAVTRIAELRRPETDARRHRRESEHSRAKARRGAVHCLRKDVPGSTSADAIHVDAERTGGIRTLSRPHGGIDQSDAQTDMNSPVRHLGIIMDGNRRWAARRGLPASLGHRAGVTAARRVVESLRRREIPFVTLYAFSSDNWRRSSDEVGAIFGVLDGYLTDEIDLLVEQRVRVQVIGRRDRLPSRTRRLVELAEARTAAGDAMLLRLAVDYSSRDAIVAAAQAYAERCGPGPALDRDAFARLLGEVAQITGGARHRPDDPHQRRTAFVRLLSVGMRVCRTLFLRCAVARLRRRRIDARARCVRRAATPLRRHVRGERRFGETG